MEQKTNHEDFKEILMKKYLDWIRNNTFLKDLKENTVKVVSPFLDAHNDYMRLYVKKLKDDSLIITDDSNLYYDVESYGIKWTDKKDSLFRSTLEAYGVSFNNINKEIFIKTDFNNIGRAKHRIIQCLINLNDMFNLTQENLKELFFHEVYDYFLDSNIKFNHDIQIRGVSGYEHKFDFAIGVSKQSQERLIRLVTNPKHKQVAENILFSFVDLEKSHRKFRGIVIYKGEASEIFLTAFKEYSYDAFSWEDKGQIVEILKE